MTKEARQLALESLAVGPREMLDPTYILCIEIHSSCFHPREHHLRVAVIAMVEESVPGGQREGG